MERRRGWTLAGVPAAIFLGPGCAEAPAQDVIPPSTTPPLAMTAALSHTAFSDSFPELLTLKIDLAAAAGPRTGRRPPLNLALVIDC